MSIWSLAPSDDVVEDEDTIKEQKNSLSLNYDVHLQTASHNYSQKYNIFDNRLLEWMHLQTIDGKFVKEEQLHKKAQEIIRNLGKEPYCIDNWLIDFCKRHKIAKAKNIPDATCTAQLKQEWKEVICGVDKKSLYIGSVCAISHSLDFGKYVNSQDTDNYLSIMYIVNGLGSDKRELAIVGKEILGTELCVRSLPVRYYCCETPQLNYSIIVDYLNKWDMDLSLEGRSIVLVLNIPEKLKDKMHFQNIKLVNVKEIKYVTIVLEKIVECFKYHYRRLHISKTVKSKDFHQTVFLDYLHMISMAWCNISCELIHHLTFPPDDGSLFIYEGYESPCLQTLSQWCKIKALNLGSDSELLDQYTFCDKKLPCLNYGQLDDSNTPVNEVLVQNEYCKSTSTIEAYQAIKRLVSYLQSKKSRHLVTTYAKNLENHLEYEFLSQMDQYIANK